MANGGFHRNDLELTRVNSLTRPLAQIKWGGRLTGDQDREMAMGDDGARSHVNRAASHGSEMALLIFQIKNAITQADESYFQ